MDTTNCLPGQRDTATASGDVRRRVVHRLRAAATADSQTDDAHRRWIRAATRC